MTTALALMLAVAQAAPAPAPARAAPAVPAVPTNWNVMPPLPWRSAPVITPDLTTFVESEVRAGHCAGSSDGIEVELAVFVRADGVVRAVVPRAIDCPSVEQFAAGLVTRFARNNLRQPAAGWYRAAITFALDR